MYEHMNRKQVNEKQLLNMRIVSKNGSLPEIFGKYFGKQL